MEEWMKTEALYKRLRQYGKSDDYPFHMPGHKRRGMVFDNPFNWDITEIDGFDDLHHPTGILKEAMAGAASVYRSDATYFLVNGSSCGILAAISAAAHPGGRLLMARNCHKSVYHGALVNQLETEYLYPEILEDFSCAGGVTAGQVEEALRQDQERRIRCVVITSPTFEGLVSDVEKIAETVHRHGAALIVDEAHGAHFPFHPAFPRSAFTLGADAVIQSLHKTLPSLTQTALLHLKGDRIDRSRVEAYLQVYQSSSPSYVLMASIDQCIRFMAGPQGREAMEKYTDSLRKVREQLSGLTHIKLLDESAVGNHGVYGLDQGKLVFSVGGTNMTGKAFYRQLQEVYHLRPEMHTDRTVTLMTSVSDSEQGFNRLLEAVRALDQEIDVRTDQVSGQYLKNEEQKTAARMTIAQAVAAPGKLVALEESAGHIAAGIICPYPPGIPLLAPGEEITEFRVSQMRRWLRQDIEIHGLQIKENTVLIPVIA